MNRRIIYALRKIADDSMNRTTNTVQEAAPSAQSTSQSLLHRMGSAFPIGAVTGAAARYMDREKLLSAIRGGQAVPTTPAGADTISRQDRSRRSLPFERVLPAAGEMWNSVWSLWRRGR